jgi:hypothetical protein
MTCCLQRVHPAPVGGWVIISWGRIEETSGESPFLTGEYAKAFIEGFQGNGSYWLASVTVKHYVAYNLEVDLEDVPPQDWCGSPLNEGGPCTLPNSRHSFNAAVSPLDLVRGGCAVQMHTHTHTHTHTNTRTPTGASC